MSKRELRNVTGSEQIGPYTLLRLKRGGLEPGVPGQFFMLEAPGRLLPRPMSVCLAPPGELAFLIDPIGPGTRALCSLEVGDSIGLLGPLGNGFRLDLERPLLVGGGIGVAPFPYLSERLGGPPAVLGFRSAWHAEAAALVPNAEVVLEPTYVTEALPGGHDVLACGPEPMLEAVRRLEPRAQLAWEAPMACGYGACYGCAVEIDGELKRLCVEGPVLVAAPTHASRTPEGAATPALAASSVAPVASGYEHSLRPCDSGVSRLGRTSRAEGDRNAAA
jgi:dihydroorotate dehydrogenase electron transfer subunit